MNNKLTKTQQHKIGQILVALILATTLFLTISIKQAFAETTQTGVGTCRVESQNGESTNLNVNLKVTTDIDETTIQGIENTAYATNVAEVNYNNPTTISYKIIVNGQEGVKWKNYSSDIELLGCNPHPVIEVSVNPPVATTPPTTSMIETMPEPEPTEPEIISETPNTTAPTVAPTPETVVVEKVVEKEIVIVREIQPAKPAVAVKGSPTFTG